ncbi:hypothetical protein FGADI_2317 [Fusarium gaditjirri]|uniref:Uncharacterized protein n=1 Tax=Fusarium gaditjirri TaxID=282569 RepID=A0A8H4X1K5_9HYPO|nr:hypothetical protein FGADI_2317 [Fusarium gaditjirri]
MPEHAALDPTILKEFIASSFPQEEDEDAERARFAHIQLPLYRDPETLWIKAVAQAFSGAFDGLKSKLMFVTAENELQMEPVDLPSMELSVDAEKISFQQLLTYLRDSFNWVTPRRMHNWKLGTWDQGILPRDAIIIFHMDPSLQADCALALAGIIQWSFDMAGWPVSDIRILTMSTSDQLHYPSQLIQIQRPGSIIPFRDLSYGSARPPATEVSTSVDTGSIVRDICQVVAKYPKSSHLIISFEETCVIEDKLLKALATTKEAGAVEVVTVSDKVDTLSKYVRPARADNVVLLQIAGDIPILPPVFRGYDNVHVIVSDRLDGRQGWHHKSRQVVDFCRHASSQQRWAQLWWLEQPAEQRWLYSVRLSVEEFLVQRFSHRHRIEDDQLGAFIAGVYDAKEWGIDCARTIRCFLGIGARVREMKRRLEAQRVLSNNKFSLPNLEAKVFRSILPVVGYDYRLALFVAADCDPTVRLLKLQLTALLIVGIEKTIIIENDIFFELVSESTELFELWIEYCIRPMRSMAKQGSLWLALGLWRTYVLLETSRMSGNRIHQLEALGQIFSGHLNCSSTQSSLAGRLLKQLRDTLQDQNIPVSGVTVLEEMETTLNEHQRSRLQSHLFRAYMHQLTASCSHQGRLVEVEFATMTEVKLITGPRQLASFIPKVALKQGEGGNCMFGINHGLQIIGGSLCARNWVWIPQRIVAEWLAETTPESDLYELLSVNCMEVDRTVDEYVE